MIEDYVTRVFQGHMEQILPNSWLENIDSLVSFSLHSFACITIKKMRTVVWQK